MKRVHHAVTIYTQPFSFYCTLTKEYFRQQGIDFDEIDISKDPAGADVMMTKSGQRVPPVVEIDGHVVSGYRPDVFDTVVHKDEKEEKDEKDEKDDRTTLI